MIRRSLRRVLDWLRGEDRYEWLLVDGEPAALKPRTLAVGGEASHRWFAVMLCPCGCAQRVFLSLHPEGRPRWSVEEHPDGTPTVSPSVRRLDGCRSHFWLERGRVRWVRVADAAQSRQVCHLTSQ